MNINCCVVQYGGLVVGTDASKQEGPGFDTSFLCGVCLLPHVCESYLWVLQLLPTVQRHAG